LTGQPLDTATPVAPVAIGPAASYQGSEFTSFYEVAPCQAGKPAVIDPDGIRTTFGELLRRCNQGSAALRAMGLAAGDRVAVLSRNWHRFLEVYHSCAQVGLFTVPVNYHLTRDEVSYILRNSDAKLVAVSEPYLELAAESLDLVGIPAARRLSLDPARGWRTWDELIEDQPSGAPPDRRMGHMMLYTSGTTGRPKGVVWPAPRDMTPESFVRAFEPALRRRGLAPGGTTLVCGPLYHGLPFGQAVWSLSLGHTAVLMERWDGERALQLIDEHRVNYAQMAPIHFTRLLQLPAHVRDRYDVSSLKSVVHAGAKCPVDVKRAMMEWFGPVLYEYYAASEASGTSITPEEWLEHPGSVGRVGEVGAATMRVLDDHGHEVAPGEVGTIWVRNPLGPTRYLDDPEKTAASRGPDDFQTVGDQGYVDPAGWLYIVERRDDLILSGGVNIYPAEIEQRLLLHPAVREIAVIAAPDPEWGQTPVAVVVAAEGVEPSASVAADLERHCRVALAGFKCPSRFEFRESLPYSASGKLLRRVLRDEHSAS
jgi:long-chain acyl-CoA synthetase